MDILSHSLEMEIKLTSLPLQKTIEARPFLKSQEDELSGGRDKLMEERAKTGYLTCIHIILCFSEDY